MRYYLGLAVAKESETLNRDALAVSAAAEPPPRAGSSCGLGGGSSRGLGGGSSRGLGGGSSRGLGGGSSRGLGGGARGGRARFRWFWRWGLTLLGMRLEGS
jgi:hypothetical protein